jgi:hypothetical protein
MSWLRKAPPSQFRVTTDDNLTAHERATVDGGEAVAACAGYFKFSTRNTELFWAKAYKGESLVAIAPVVRLRKRKATDLLRQPLRKWLGLLFGPLANKTTLLLDTAFMAYDARSPFLTAPGVDRAAVKREISDFLKKQKKVDTLWISEPPDEAAWAVDDNNAQNYSQFHTLPMVQVVLEGYESLEHYLATLSRNSRRNFKREREVFAKAGGVIDVWEGVIGDNPNLHAQVMSCLEASAAHSKFTVPYNDVLTAPAAIGALRQIVLTARLGDQRLGDKVIGFMSCLQDGDRLMQCHGGLNYVESHEVKAYHNLISHAIELGIARRCRVLTLGPNTNETKARAGGRFRPIVSSMWNKLPGDRLVARKLFIKNFEVYRGELGSGQTEDGNDE